MFNTIVASDLHLSDFEPVDFGRQFWKLYKRRELSFDDDFLRMLGHTASSAKGPVELVLNGDTFDFDNVTTLPKDTPPGEEDLDWLMRLRGLGSQEWMSCFKIDRIIAAHEPLFARLGEFVRAGNKLVFVIGNHDLELNWCSVQQRVIDALGVGDDDKAGARVVFCRWFYLSAGDTYISHGHQYDPFCSLRNPIDPMISMGDKKSVRLPFGDLTERFMLNGVGYINPHATSNFIMGFGEYVRLFVRYMLLTHPLLLWTWFWGAVVTVWQTYSHFLRPAQRDPLRVEENVAEVAAASQVEPATVRTLNAMHVPSAASNPLRIVRELWLDRGLWLLGILYLASNLFLAINVVWPISPWWIIVGALLMSPPYVSYALSVRSMAFSKPLLTPKTAEMIARVTGVDTIVFGHSHAPEESQVGGLKYINCGFWSPAYAEPECVHRIGGPTFVEIVCFDDGKPRKARLWKWPPQGEAPEPF